MKNDNKVENATMISSIRPFLNGSFLLVALLALKMKESHKLPLWKSDRVKIELQSTEIPQIQMQPRSVIEPQNTREQDLRQPRFDSCPASFQWSQMSFVRKNQNKSSFTPCAPRGRSKLVP